VREVQEETGALPARLYNTPLTNVFYLSADDAANVSPVLAALLDKKTEVKLFREHAAFAWLGKDEAISRLVWPGAEERHSDGV